MRETVVGFGSKILQFCLKIKSFAQMLEKEVLFAKFKTIMLHIAKIRKNLVNKLTSDVLIFTTALKD